MKTVAETSITAVAGSVAVGAAEAGSRGNHIVDAELLHEKNISKILLKN
jgi:hypothetical protein